MKLAFLHSCIIVAATALPQYAERIPNGYTVPNPDPEGGVWAGVGHVNTGGGGERNQFGLAFVAEGHEWTVALCEMDSDGDGRSNGIELGDPDCIWIEGADPEGPALSHPGIFDEPKEPVKDTCEEYVAPDDEIAWDIGFSVPTEIDESRTHYICEQRIVKVPAREVLHKIKHEVILDNSDVLHHVFVFVCDDNATSTDGNKVDEGPYTCTGNESGCRRIAGWAVGPKEQCLPPNIGELLDFSDLDTVVVKIEAHYDNANGIPQQDQSGIRLHLTQTLRPLTGGGVMGGMAAVDARFLIPAQQQSYNLSGLCPTAITEHMERPAYAYSFTPHMHLYGRSLVTEHYRCGEKVGELGRIGAYEFDNQQTYTFDPPIKILPGDALVTTCEFDTTASVIDIEGGEETTNEMCLNFISVYPSPTTESIPSLMGICLSFEEGVKRDDRVVDIRVAFGDADQMTRTQDFVSDPAENIGACCATNSCEEMYLAGINEACAVDTDCNSALVCIGGLREESALVNGGETNGDSSDPDSPEDPSNGSGGVQESVRWFFTVIAMISLLACL